ncbi:MAG: energy-coupling factor transporter transmembrane component T [Chloroflexota bacterium]
MSASLYQPRRSGLHALNPLTKLMLTLAAVVGAATLPTLAGVLAVFVLGLVPLAAWARLLRPFLRACIRVVWPFAVSLFPIQGFFNPGATILLTLGPFNLKAEGLWTAALLTSRLLTALGAATLLLLTTRPDTLMTALVQRGLPGQASYIIVTALQIIPGFQARARSILDAQRSRGLETEGGLRQRLRALLPLVAPLILSSLMELEERAMALEARAFNRHGRKTSLTEIPDSAVERAARLALLALMAWLVIARVIWAVSP